MPKLLSQEVKQKIVQLRVDNKLSLNEIHRLTGVSKGSLSSLLSDYPLPSEVKSQKQAVAYVKLAERNRSDSRKHKLPDESKFYQAVKDKQLSSTQAGLISEAAILFRLVLHGFKVYGSPLDGGAVDWLAESPSKRLYRIQVKTVRFDSNNAPRVSNRCSEGRSKLRKYSEEEYDFLVGYCLKTDTAYVFSSGEAKNRGLITCFDKDAERWDKML